MTGIKKLRMLALMLIGLIPVHGILAQTTFTVTSTALGSPSCPPTGSPPAAYTQLDCIINEAVTRANTGQNVIIYFKAPGLVQLPHQVPSVTVSSGSLIMDRDPAAVGPQGIQFTGVATNNAYGYGLGVLGSTSSVLIQNLNFKDFIANPTLTTRTAMLINNSTNVTVTNCVFENNDLSMFNYSDKNLVIKNNTFINNGLYRCIDHSVLFNHTTPFDATIKNNTFTGSSPSNSTAIGVWYNPGITMANTKTDILNNTDNGYNIGVIVNGYNQTQAAMDNTFVVNITNNAFTNTSNNVYLGLPFKNLNISNNTFKITNSGVVEHVRVFNANAAYTGNPFGVDMVNTNSLGYTVVNSGNNFLVDPANAPAHRSFEINGFSATGNHIIGQDLTGNIICSAGDHTVIRQSKIKSTFSPDRPIILSNANGNIQKPVIANASLNGNLVVNYTLSNTLSNSNAPFAVDFYKSNSNGDLVEYIGTQAISTLTGGTYTASLPVPSTVPLNTSDRVAATVTSLGNSSNTPLGTSEVSYISIPPCDNCLVPEPCDNCISSFAPVPGSTYLIGAWVKEDNAPRSKASYDYPQIFVEFPGTGQSFGPFTAKGQIIDGWQRVEEYFQVPAGASTVDIKLLSTNGNCFFDDIRVFPKDGSMKSYVYDPVTLRLSAELDERNYATLYEYDEEGKLVRVKKETERGVMTIKEARNSMIKK